MDNERAPVDSHRLNSLAEKMHDKRYRDGYVASHTRRLLAQQMRNFRGDLSQSQFAEALGKKQTVISRLENPSYGAWQLRTMLEIAQKLDVAVFARFVDFPTFLKLSDDLSDKALRPMAYEQEGVETAASPAKPNSVSGGDEAKRGSAWNDFFPAGKQLGTPMNDDLPSDSDIADQKYATELILSSEQPERRIR